MENGIAAQILGREEEHTRSAHTDIQAVQALMEGKGLGGISACDKVKQMVSDMAAYMQNLPVGKGEENLKKSAHAQLKFVQDVVMIKAQLFSDLTSKSGQNAVSVPQVGDNFAQNAEVVGQLHDSFSAQVQKGKNPLLDHNDVFAALDSVYQKLNDYSGEFGVVAYKLLPQYVKDQTNTMSGVINAQATIITDMGLQNQNLADLANAAIRTSAETLPALTEQVGEIAQKQGETAANILRTQHELNRTADTLNADRPFPEISPRLAVHPVRSSGEAANDGEAPNL